MYRFPYVEWAEASHGSNFDRVLQTGADGDLAIPEMRLQVPIVQLAQAMSGVLLKATHLQVRKFRPDQSVALAEWYRIKVSEPFLRLMNAEVEV
jgi:hypothetical protein